MSLVLSFVAIQFGRSSFISLVHYCVSYVFSWLVLSLIMSYVTYVFS